MNESEPPFTIEIRCADAVELVTEYLDEALSQADLAIFEKHLDSCEGCTVFVDQIKMSVTIASEIGKQQIEIMPDNFDMLVDLLAQQNLPPSS